MDSGNSLRVNSADQHRWWSDDVPVARRRLRIPLEGQTTTTNLGGNGATRLDGKA